MPEGTRKILLGRVLTLTDGLRTRRAVSIRDGRIAGVGAPDELQDGSDEVEILDFGERTLMPGFVDTHAHVALTAVGAETMVDCRVPQCSSVEDILQKLSDSLGETQDGWLMARSSLLLDQKLADRRLPTRDELDRVSGTVPIALRTSHLSVLNSSALNKVDIDRFIGLRQGSLGPVTIEMGSDGRPNGIVSNLDAMLPFPEPDEATVSRAIEENTIRQFTANGVTSICEMSDTRQSLDVMVDLIDRGRLTSRFSVFLMSPGTLSFEQACNWRDQGIHERPGVFEIRGIKVFADGGYSSRDAAVHHPYAESVALESGPLGKLNFTEKELADMFIAADHAGLQVALHTNGERAQEQVCLVTEKLRLNNALPVRLEHAGNFVYEKNTPEMWRRGSALPVPQPMFIYTMAPYMPIYLGDYGARHGRLPFKTLTDAGWDLPAGSDAYWALEDEVTNPLWSIWCCMKRLGFDGQLIDPEEAIDLETALRMHTIFGARLLDREEIIGTLETDKLADIVVLDRDITSGITVDDLPGVKVDSVYVGGEQVYLRTGAEGAELASAAAHG